MGNTDGQVAPVVTYEALIGQVIRKLRENRLPGYSQAKMAAAVGVSQPYWSKVEQGGANPSFKLLDSTAAVLGMSQSRLLEMVEDAKALAEARGARVVHRQDIPGLESDWVPIVGAAAIGALIGMLLAKK